MPLSVDRASRLSIDCHLTVSIDAQHQRAGILFLLGVLNGNAKVDHLPITSMLAEKV
ncbi:hypothetical protein F2Q70_00012026 [Brassica cretica]|uniref:Uncharacterized protein n=1 Tax=Brassica cretica TaxID=69181 RepID=A0A8S9M3Y1_BRACR|nr:hypothetical protein F2Q70_00012026 [Brassica cretica]